METADLFTIGKVTGIHGLGGNLKIWSFAESIDTFKPGTIVLLSSKEGQKPYPIKRAWAYKKGILLDLEGIDSREAAMEVVGNQIQIQRHLLAEPDEDTWYWQDLLGLTVMDQNQTDIGRITDIFPTGAHDILVVMLGNKETLIPMHRQFVESIDLKQQIVTVRLPEGY